MMKPFSTKKNFNTFYIIDQMKISRALLWILGGKGNDLSRINNIFY